MTTDEGLYLIAQNLRVTKKRQLLLEIQEYLSKAGVFVDEVRRNPKTVVETGDAVIKMYQKMGKSDEWIQMRINPKIHRVAFHLPSKPL